MKTPREKYMNDPQYRCLVEHIEHFIHQAEYTPSEIREACMLACIHYEMKIMRTIKIDDPEVLKAFDTLGRFKDTNMS